MAGSSPPTLGRGYQQAGQLLARHGYSAVPLLPGQGPFRPAVLREHAAVVLASAPQGRGRLTGDELAALESYVRDGGRLLLLGTYTGDWHHEANLNEVAGRYGVTFNRDLVLPATAAPEHGRSQVYEVRATSAHAVRALPAVDPQAAGAEPAVARLVAGVRGALTLSSCSLAVTQAASPVLRSVPESKVFEPLPIGVTFLIDRYEERRTGPSDVIAVADGGAVVVVGGFKMFLDSFVERTDSDNARLLENILLSLAAPK